CFKRGRGGDDNGNARGCHQRLVGTQDEYINTPRVSPNWDCSEARYGIDNEKRASRFRHRAEPLEIEDDAGRRLTMNEEHRLDVGSRIQHLLDVLCRWHNAPL